MAAVTENDNSSAETIKEELGRHTRGMMAMILFAGLLSPLLFFWASTGILLAPNPFASMAWWLILGILIAPFVGFGLRLFDKLMEHKRSEASWGEFFAEVGIDFVDYIIVRVILAVLVVMVMLLAWTIIILILPPSNLWIALAGSQAAHTTGMGGLGWWIIVITSILFLVWYFQLLKTLVSQPPRVLLWLGVWTALCVLCLLPAFGWSTTFGLT